MKYIVKAYRFINGVRISGVERRFDYYTEAVLYLKAVERLDFKGGIEVLYNGNR